MENEKLIKNRTVFKDARDAAYGSTARLQLAKKKKEILFGICLQNCAFTEDENLSVHTGHPQQSLSMQHLSKPLTGYASCLPESIERSCLSVNLMFRQEFGAERDRLLREALQRSRQMRHRSRSKVDQFLFPMFPLF